ncbi:MAG: signal peptidase I [Hyphomicrobiales bacterium]|nr:MAG: signal peptidase I [Hyphomicrobiales bacterium]
MISETKTKNKNMPREIWELIKVVVQALLIALVVRSFIFTLVFIPTASMVPTLLIGDYLYISKYAYGYSKHSVPFSALPVVGRIFGVEPKLGDIVVFRGVDQTTDYIKRLVGLPGDEIQMVDGVLQINGKAVGLVKVSDFDETDAYGNVETVGRYIETLPNDVAHQVLNYGNVRADHTGVYHIPEGHYFMMGDSRDNSNDSRFQDVVRMVAFEDIVGRADFILLSFAHSSDSWGGVFWEFWNWPQNLRTERMFQSLATFSK